MFQSFISKLERVFVAKSKQEFESIYRLRYQVYVEELKKGFLKDVDHDQKFVQDPEDHRKDSLLLYTGSPDNITGTVRVDIYPAGSIPATIEERFSLKQFSKVKDYAVCELGRLVINKNSRGLLILPALSRAVYQHAAIDQDIHFGFLYCAPGLVGAYRRLGFRPYRADLVHNPDGVRIPLVMLASDLDYFREVSSPHLDLAKKKFKSFADSSIEEIKNSMFSGVSALLEKEDVWQYIQHSFFKSELNRDSFAQSLTAETLRYLSEKGFVVDVAEQKKVVREGLVEKEMFIILDGTFHVTRGNKTLAVLEKGDLFGEMAFFLESGQRTASVHSVTAGRLLLLRRKAVLEMMTENPDMAAKLLYHICVMLSKRLSLA
ncbi:MAG: cyclic nucleotide-binding domain-containing protein [Deltaproteobacteria bacterium]|nr:cyclic nucleotide-binding domain-containing protein [Deltaproteobacteria bacterium]